MKSNNFTLVGKIASRLRVLKVFKFPSASKKMDTNQKEDANMVTSTESIGIGVNKWTQANGEIANQTNNRY